MAGEMTMHRRNFLLTSAFVPAALAASKSDFAAPAYEAPLFDLHKFSKTPIKSKSIEWLRAGKVLANQQLKVVFENDVLAVLDGRGGAGSRPGRPGRGGRRRGRGAGGRAGRAGGRPRQPRSMMGVSQRFDRAPTRR